MYQNGQNQNAYGILKLVRSLFPTTSRKECCDREEKRIILGKLKPNVKIRTPTPNYNSRAMPTHEFLLVGVILGTD